MLACTATSPAQKDELQSVRDAERYSQGCEERGTICLAVRRRVHVKEFLSGDVAMGWRRMDDSDYRFDVNDEGSSRSLISGGGAHV